MKLKSYYEHELPAHEIEALGLTEGSVLETVFTDGKLIIHPLSEDEARTFCPVAAALCEGECSKCPVLEAACVGECLGCAFHGLCNAGRDSE